MAQTITWKKSNILTITIKSFLLLALFLKTIWAYSYTAKVYVPRLKNAGIIPTQWQGTTNYYLNKGIDLVDDAWTEAAKRSGRFTLVNKQVVADLWNTPLGRQKLRSEFEVDTFLSLLGQIKADKVVLTMRLISPDMKTIFLQETETINRIIFEEANKKNLTNIIENLVFRTFNRLPIDITVTSINGEFITLSGGQNQKIQTGDTIDLIESKITAIHPATGEWIKFSNKIVGKGEIIESKPTASIARIVSLIHEDALKIGHGSVANTITSRNKFRDISLTKKPKQKLQSPILYPPQAQKKTAKQLLPPSVKIEPATTAPPVEPSIADEGKTDSNDHGFMGAFQNTFSYTEFSPSMSLWSYSGAEGISVSSQLPVWLFNRLGFRGGMELLPTIYLEARSYFEFGTTAKGNYIGFGAGLGSYYRIKLAGPLSANLDVGGFGEFNSLGVSGEKFGGEDALKLSAYAKYTGTLEISDNNDQLKLHAELGWAPEFIPVILGSMGARGENLSMTSYSNFHFDLGAVLVDEPGEFEWGGGLTYLQESFGLGSQSISGSEVRIKALAQYRF